MKWLERWPSQAQRIIFESIAVDLDVAEKKT